MDELRFAQAIEVRGYGIELVDHVLLHVGGQRPAVDANGLCPRGETVVGTGEAPGQRNDAPPA